jgi:hypothetical protein
MVRAEDLLDRLKDRVAYQVAASFRVACRLLELVRLEEVLDLVVELDGLWVVLIREKRWNAVVGIRTLPACHDDSCLCVHTQVNLRLLILG